MFVTCVHLLVFRVSYCRSQVTLPSTSRRRAETQTFHTRQSDSRQEQDDELPSSLLASAQDEVIGHYTLPWAMFVTMWPGYDSVRQLLTSSEEVVLSVFSGKCDLNCPNGGLTLKAAAVCSCPAGKQAPARVLATQTLLEEELSYIDAHCCKDPSCPAHPAELCLQDADRLTEDCYQLMASDWRNHVLRARLEAEFNVDLPLRPASKLQYFNVFQDHHGRTFAYKPSAGSLSRDEHTKGPSAWQTGVNVEQGDFHASFWILALLWERLRQQFYELKGRDPEGSDKGVASNYERFAHNYMRRLRLSDLQHLEPLTDDRRHVKDPPLLTKQLRKFVDQQMELNRNENVVQFKSLHAFDVDVLRLCVETAQAAVFVLPDVSFLALLSGT